MEDMLEVIGAEAGMHLVALLPPGTNDVAVSRKAAQRGHFSNALVQLLFETTDEGRPDSWLRGRQYTSDSRWNAQTQDERTGPDRITRLG